MQLSDESVSVVSTLPPWNYNPLHDVESVLWLTKFFTENHDVIFISKENGSELDEEYLRILGIAQDTPSAPRGTRLDAQYTQVAGVFYRTDRRVTELTVARKTLERWHIHPGLNPQRIYHYIETMRVRLISEYRRVEGGFAERTPKAFELGPNLYWAFFGALKSLGKAVQDIPAYVCLVPLANASSPR